jgi:hypothetical protein
MDYSKLTVAELKKHIREYKHIHCKPYSKLKRAGLEALAKEFEHHLKMDSKLAVRKEAHKLILKRSGPIGGKEAKEPKASKAPKAAKAVAGKKAPTEKQLEARRKFVEMVRAKSAGKKAAAAPKEPKEPMEPKAKAPRVRKPKGERVAKAVARLEPVSDANKVIKKQEEASRLIVSAMTGKKNA